MQLRDASIDYMHGDYKNALKGVRPLAAEGNPQAQNILAHLYLKGLGVNQDINEAVRLLKLSAAVDDKGAAARLSLGELYAKGELVPQDNKAAFYWYEKAASDRVVDAYLALGKCYELGLGVTQNTTEALKWYQAAADSGAPDGHSALGRLYASGATGTVDYKKAVELYRSALAHRDFQAQFLLGGLYYNGSGVVQNYVAAYALLNLASANPKSIKSLAADQRNTVAAKMTPAQIAAGQDLTLAMAKDPVGALDLAVTGAECNTVIELKLEHHAA